MATKWTNFYKLVQQNNVSTTTVTDNQTIGMPNSYGNYNWYHKIIQGSGSRISRYREWDMMDSDIDISRALDLIAEEITGNCSKTDEPIELSVIDIEHMSSSEVTTIKTALRHWNEIHRWKSRLFDVSRYVVKYGDIFFRKKDEVGKWQYIHPKDVVGAIVNSEDVTEVKGWQIHTELTEANIGTGVPHSGVSGMQSTENFTSDEIVRFTLNNDMSENAPFGESVLKPIYRTFKQKELLEDAVIIYRIQRAPERRVFYVDVGKMPPQRVKQYLEGIKNEIRQKKIPTHNGQNSEIESTYNPQCITFTTEIPLLNGEVKSLGKLIEDYHNGIENWVYSVDQKTGEFIPGLIEWAGATRQNAEIIRVHLSTGQYLDCTPDHKFITDKLKEIEAEYLENNQQLATLYIDKPTKDTVYVETIEYLDYTEDTGCLTIKDKGNNHNFGISPGIYIKNSQSEDYFLAQRCISLNTEIKLLNGENKELKDLIKDHENGVENWVYSVDKATGKFIPGKISWAGETRKNAELVRVHFDNDQYLDCTPDHKLIDRNGNEVEAQHLIENDSMMGLYTNFKDEYHYNHKIIKVEWLDYTEDTGCLTIEDPGDNHNFGISAGVYICNSDGRGSKIETLPGGASVGEISDVEYFSDKMFRGLRIPLSYMKEGDAGGAMFNDGKVGQAYITELRFSLYIERLQSLIEEVLDKEFKAYLRYIGLRIDNTKFNIVLPEPSNFGKYREQEMYAALLSSYSSADGIEYLSKKFIMQKYLQMTNDEIIENERLKLEELGEDPDNFKKEVLTKMYAPDSIGDDMGDGMGGGMDFDPGSSMVPDMGGEAGLLDSAPEVAPE